MNQTTTESRRALGLFLAVAFGVMWLLVSPAWLTDKGLESPAVDFPMGMFAPSVAVLVVWWWLHRRSPEATRGWARRTGLGFGPDRGRTWRVIGATWVAVPVLTVVAVLLSVAVGVLDLDLTHFGALREGLGQDFIAHTPGGAKGALVLMMAESALLGTAMTAPFALGEEWGWRGWLQPELIARWGTVRGLVVTGLIWGLWHAPLTLLGYNYPSLGPWAALWFLPFTVLVGSALGWLRHVTGSVWPAVVGHAAINSTVDWDAIAGPAGVEPNYVLVGPTGLVGWAVVATVVAVLPRLLPLRHRSRPTS